jgi:hypothetical protein
MIWYECDSILPDDNEIVLMADEVSGFVTLGRYHNDGDEFEVMGLDPIEQDAVFTHWGALPEYDKDDE